MPEDCHCLKHLDDLRFKHEAGTVERFAIFVVDSDAKGRMFHFGHNIDLSLLLDVAKAAIGQVEQRLAEAE